jgi:hypothetical protein
MSITRYFTGTAIDGTRYDFVEECSSGASAPRYRLSSLGGGYLTKISDSEFTIVRSGVNIHVH